jgi:hypothetical protein
MALTQDRVVYPRTGKMIILTPFWVNKIHSINYITFGKRAWRFAAPDSLDNGNEIARVRHTSRPIPTGFNVLTTYYVDSLPQ